MVQEKTEITSLSNNLVTGEVSIKISHKVIFDSGRVLEDAQKPKNITINFSEILKTPITTEQPPNETRVIGTTLDQDGNTVEVTEEYTPLKPKNRLDKYNERLELLTNYIRQDNRMFNQVKSNWSFLLMEKAQQDGEQWDLV
jgi:hypothetical protein